MAQAAQRIASNLNPISKAGAAAGQFLDDNFKIGKKAGGLMVILWTLLTWINFLIPPWIGLIFCLFILNCCVVSPNFIFRISKWFVKWAIRLFGDVETLGGAEIVIKALDSLQFRVKVPTWAKLLVGFTDFIAFIFFVSMYFAIMIMVCNSPVGYLIKIKDFFSSSGICTSFSIN